MGLISAPGRESAACATPGWEVAAASARGLHRTHNEDAFGILDEVVCVADGRGGSPEPSVAVRVVEQLERALGWCSSPLGDPLARAVMAANEALCEAFARDIFAGSLAATLAAARLGSDWITLAHVGDARIGRFQKKNLSWLTEDQSLRTEARRAGTPLERLEEIERRFSGIVTAVLGVERRIPLELAYHPVEAGTTLLLCTDGLWRHVPQRSIEEILVRDSSLSAACAALVQGALDGGVPDGVAVVLARVSA